METNITTPINCSFSTADFTNFPVLSDKLIILDLCSSSSLQLYYWIIISLCLFLNISSMIYILIVMISMAQRKTWYKLFSATCLFLFQASRVVIFIDWRGFRGIFSPLWTYLCIQVAYGVLFSGGGFVVIYWIVIIVKSKELKKDFKMIQRKIVIFVSIIGAFYMIAEAFFIWLGQRMNIPQFVNISQIILALYCLTFLALVIYSYVMVYKNMNKMKNKKFNPTNKTGSLKRYNIKFKSRYRIATIGVFPGMILCFLASIGIAITQTLRSSNAITYMTLLLIVRVIETITLVLGIISVYENPLISFLIVFCCYKEENKSPTRSTKL